MPENGDRRGEWLFDRLQHTNSMRMGVVRGVEQGNQRIGIRRESTSVLFHDDVDDGFPGVSGQAASQYPPTRFGGRWPSVKQPAVGLTVPAARLEQALRRGSRARR
jgi:hypothetical protein